MRRVGFDQLELNPFTVIGEDTFLLTAGSSERWNTMTAGWGGLGYLWNEAVAYVFVRQSRYTYGLMESSRMFSLSFFPPELKGVLDYCGSHSGADTDKAKGAGITPMGLDGTVAFEEANLVMTCTKLSHVLLDDKSLIDESIAKLYPHGDWHHMYIGRIEGVYVS